MLWIIYVGYQYTTYLANISHETTKEQYHGVLNALQMLLCLIIHYAMKVYGRLEL